MALNKPINSERAAALAAMMAHEPVQAGRMFGCPAYFCNGMPVAVLINDGVAVKVGASRARALIGQPGIELFAPLGGRAWREWAHITGSLEAHRAVLAEAVEYALVISGG
ncbi:MAG: hypothetical protein ACUVSX_06355 [Aggregatilineales bacterium]